MTVQKLLNSYRTEKKKGVVVLLDPDKIDFNSLPLFLANCERAHVAFLLVGGSLISSPNQSKLLQAIKHLCRIPAVLFPGNALHVSPEADAILFLSLISGRNPDFLIGQQVVAAPHLKRSQLEIIPTGYMLVDSGVQTTASYISNTTPLPNDKPDVAACTALAGQYLGMQLLYMDGGSGAKYPVSAALIRAVATETSLPLIVGGGINTIEKATTALEAGADFIVIGNALEENPSFLPELAEALSFSPTLLP